MKTRILLTITATILAFSAAPAHATAGADAVTKRVSVAGIDYTAAKDVEKLYLRLKRASKDVCTYSSAPTAYSATCAAAALDHSVQELNRPELQALHAARRG
jgi:UrcA family protein